MITYKNIYSLSNSKILVEEGGKRLKGVNKETLLNKPFFSIITVVKNDQKNICSTIESVIRQAKFNIEYIVIDGNSTDGTQNKIKLYQDKIDYWCSIRDKGLYDAMNYGLKLSNGEVIGIINSGDLYKKNSFKIVKKYFLEIKDLAFLFGTVKRYYLGGDIITKSGFNRNRIKYNFDSQTCHSSGFFIKSNVQKKFGLYNLKYKCSSDYNLFYNIFSNKKIIGHATKKNELIGIVASGGFSSKYGFLNRIKEELQIRIDNNQNLFLIIIIFFNAVLKNYLKKLNKLF